MSYSRYGRGYTKPLPGAQLDPSHPLSRGLIVCLPMNEGSGSRINDLSGMGRHFTIGGGAVFGATQRGTGIVQSAVLDSYATTPSAQFIPSSNVTMVHGLRKKGIPQASTAIGLSPDNAGARCGCHLPFSDGTIYFDFGGTSEGTTRLSVPSLNITDNIWTFTTGPRGMEIWQDGAKRASNSSNATRGATTTEAFALGGGSGAGVFDLVDAHFFYMYARQLSTDEIRWISAEPYAMFAAPQYRRFFVPVVEDEISGTSALQTEAFTLSSTGTVAATGTSALSTQPFTSAATGVVTISGTSALTTEVFTLSSTGTVTDSATGTSALSTQVFTLAATGTVAATGTSALSTEVFTLASTGTVTAPTTQKYALLLGVG